MILDKSGQPIEYARERYDGVFVDAIAAGHAARRQKRYEAVGQYTAEQLLGFYNDGGVIAAIVDKYASESIRAGISIKGMDKADELLSDLEDVGFSKALCEAMTWNMACGGAIIHMVMDDGKDFSQPLDEEAGHKIIELRVYDPTLIQVKEVYSDIAAAKYGEPSLYGIHHPTVLTTGNHAYINVHASRCLVFKGFAVNKRESLSSFSNGWGRGIISKIMSEWQEWASSRNYLKGLLERAQQGILTVPGLQNMLSTAASAKNVTQRAQDIDTARSIANTIVLHGGLTKESPSESYEIKSAPLSGAVEIMDRFSLSLCAASGIPARVLQLSPPRSGIGDSSSSEMHEWAKTVGRIQNTLMRDQVEKLVFLCANSRGLNTEDYEVEFNPLSAVSDVENSDIIKNNVDAIEKMYRMNALDQEEIRGIAYELGWNIDPSKKIAPNVPIPEPGINPEPEPKEEPTPQPEPTLNKSDSVDKELSTNASEEEIDDTLARILLNNLKKDTSI